MANTHAERIRALADAFGFPEDSVVDHLRRHAQNAPTHSDGVPVLPNVDQHSTDEQLVDEAYRHIGVIRKGTGR